MWQQPHRQPDGVVGGARDVGAHLSRGFHLVEIWCRPCRRMEHISVHDLPLHLPIGACIALDMQSDRGRLIANLRAAADLIEREASHRNEKGPAPR